MRTIRPPIYRILCQQCRRTVAMLCDGSLIIVPRHGGHYHVVSYGLRTLRRVLEAMAKDAHAVITLTCSRCELPAARARLGGIEFCFTHAGERHITNIPLALIVRTLEEQEAAVVDIERELL